MENVDAEVIIVGAGPTGLMLAGELRLAGVTALVLERLTEPVQQSRALGFSARAVEEFDQRGLLPHFGEIQTIPVGHFGGLPVDFRAVERGSYGARGIPQSRTEAVLAQWASGLGAEVRRGYDVTALAEGHDGVEVTAECHAGTQRLRGAWVIGCDGAHSSVRRLAGIGFPGTEPVIEMWLADVTGTELRPRFSGERVPGGMVMVLPAGPGVYRVGLYERAARPAITDRTPTFPEVAAAWQRLTGENIRTATPLWISKFTDASRQAGAYRKGRVFVAGDAAHVHLPQGAQGMSAGIGDAMNLAWKLAATIRGHAPAGLLDTYHTERHAVGERILANTLAQRILYLGDEELDALREVFTDLLAEETVQRHLAGLVSGLDIRYDTVPGGHPLLGVRLPDHELVRDMGGGGESCKTTSFALMHAGRPLLLDLADDPRIRTAAGPWCDRVDLVTATAHAEAWTGIEGVDALLVRPDGYIAWVAPRGAGPIGLPTALARWFGPAAALN